jgi:hypothetical protein
LEFFTIEGVLLEQIELVGIGERIFNVKANRISAEGTYFLKVKNGETREFEKIFIFK